MYADLLLVGVAILAYVGNIDWLLKFFFLASGLLGLYRTAQFISQERGYFFVFSGFIQVTYCLGAFVTLSFGDVEEVVFQTLQRSFSIAAVYVGAIYFSIFISALNLISKVLPEVKLCDLLNETGFRSDKERNGFLWVLFFVSILQVYLLATGQFGYMGYQRLEDEGADNFVAFIEYLTKPFLPAFIYLFATTDKGKKPQEWYVYLFVMLVNVAWNFLYGRRFLIFGIAVGVIMFYAYKYGKQKASKIFFWIICGGVLVVLIAIPFSTMRLVIDASEAYRGEIGGFTINDMLDSLGQFSFAEGFQSLMDNIRYRVFYFGYLSEVLSASDFSTATYGLQIINPIIMLVPGAARYFEISSAEALLHPLLGWFFWDEAWSLVVGSIADFYVFGIIVYPFVFVGYFYLMYRITFKISNHVIRALSTAGLILIAFNVEADPTFYTIFFRTIAVYYIADFALRWNRKGLKN